MALGTALLVVFILWLLILSPVSRAVGVAIAVLVVVAVAVLLATDKRRSGGWIAHEEAERNAERQRESEHWLSISPNAVELRQVAIASRGPGHRDTDQGFTFQANVKNNAPQRMGALVIEFTAYDCPTTASPVEECETIGHGSSPIEVTVPPNEVRAIAFSFEMKNFPSPHGVLTWRARVASIRN
ncbi:hypothetical protein [Methylocystis bryophila]|uniref:Uncharacterized protein n=1 Tax=Methylocystis bryophila TaxID=655015 RepID=A0A1W6MXY1_9HYPH|nr:hypothetical protein [Methylocystis bryophila]ARN82441.1 hypothetical protein B1812_16645 [Methylocystis bryophila]BDV38625.1 hypothetical protein DSM21852_18780 [Methylocystis bryophila]